MAGTTLRQLSGGKFLAAIILHMTEKNSTDLLNNFQRTWKAFWMDIIIFEEITSCFISITWPDDWCIQRLEKFIVLNSSVSWLILIGIVSIRKFDFFPKVWFSPEIFITYIISLSTLLNCIEYGRVKLLTPFYLNQQHTYMLFTTN